MKNIAKKIFSWKTAAIVGGAVVTAGVGYFIYQNYFAEEDEVIPEESITDTVREVLEEVGEELKAA